MKILHYALGFPPYRSGGLTKFCVDLMMQQKSEGHEVAMLWPGKMRLLDKRVSIKKNSELVKGENISSFEIVNPLPVSLDEGIKDFQEYTKECGMEAYNHLLQSYEPDVIHVHTLMGIHKSFFEVARNMGIRLVFSAHDFFPICPKVTMFRQERSCETVKDCKDCAECNNTALSLKKIFLLQMPLYRKLKNTTIIKKMRKRHRDEYLRGESVKENVSLYGTAADYIKLREYYYSMLKMMDVIHYNSSITERAYENIFDLPKKSVIEITHADIRDKRKIKEFSDDKIRIRYLGPQSREKGYFLLKEALDKLWVEQSNFCLDIHFSPIELEPYMQIHERYTYEDLEEIFDDTDVLVAPSIWNETFGFTVLEAMSYGVPVILSGTVGAKDIVCAETGIIIEEISPERLYKTFLELNAQRLERMNIKIVERQKIMQIQELSCQIAQKCYEWKI